MCSHLGGKPYLSERHGPTQHRTDQAIQAHTHTHPYPCVLALHLPVRALLDPLGGVQGNRSELPLHQRAPKSQPLHHDPTETRTDQRKHQSVNCWPGHSGEVQGLLVLVFSGTGVGSTTTSLPSWSSTLRFPRVSLRSTVASWGIPRSSPTRPVWV